MGTADDVRHTGSSAASSVGEAVSDAPRVVARKTQGNPLAMGLIAFGVGWLTSALIPATEPERKAAAKAREAAAPLAEEVKGAAKEAAEHLREPAKDAATAVKDTATDAASSMKEEGAAAARDVKRRASNRASNLATRLSSDPQPINQRGGTSGCSSPRSRIGEGEP